jgi:hypothetical protein
MKHAPPLGGARFCWHYLDDGGDSTANATIRRTSGSTASKVGNATSHDIAHAAGHVATKAGVGPRLLSVEIADTTNVMSTDNTSGMTIAA